MSLQEREWASFSAKGRVVNILGFVYHIRSLLHALLCVVVVVVSTTL